MKGTTPEGARSEQEAATWVRAMFGRVAHRYDLANHLLSFNIDRLWRARTVRRVRPILERPDARVLDICCGTGDLVVALQHACARPAVFGSDFCHPMLVAARRKVPRRHAPSLLFESDALRLPVRDGSLDLITVAFGFRNLANYEAACAKCGACCGPAAWRPSWNSRSRRTPSSARCTWLLFAPRSAVDRRACSPAPRRLPLSAGIDP